MYQGTVVYFARAWKQWLKIECSDCSLFPIWGDLDLEYPGKLLRESEVAK